MKLLLDTHVFLWLVSGDPRLSSKATEAFLEPDNTPHLSAASYWEICIKHSLGKLDLAPGWQKAFETELLVNEIHWLPIEREHCDRLEGLPFHHGDPFDRLLIAQALAEGMTLVTSDRAMADYPAPTLW